MLRQMSETFPGAQILAAFGQTEMSPVTCMLLGEDAIRKRGSVGRVIPTVAARVVDDDMNDVPVGEVGEIVYRAPTLMSGYWNNPEATAEAFAGGWFHSGDLVRMDDEGYVWVVDRKKDMIISGGENIYCAEVENVLASHPAIVEVAVIGRADERWAKFPSRSQPSIETTCGSKTLTNSSTVGWRATSTRRVWKSWMHCRVTRPERCSRPNCADGTAPRRSPTRTPKRAVLQPEQEIDDDGNFTMAATEGQLCGLRCTRRGPSGTVLWSLLLPVSREAAVTHRGSGQGGGVRHQPPLHLGARGLMVRGQQ
ncbi:AMP-binding enzyme family protein [Mycobacterium xenopi 4042]|uniref:AMP-binding enzyme family protein n=1 Tax=Mycobacterium xenopi 4042 TaxID=1299334 RepID=X8BKJ3_MYCXE|nr:AMP-binding enzyme family protein [Mycobacterium xenopi 4042]